MPVFSQPSKVLGRHDQICLVRENGVFALRRREIRPCRGCEDRNCDGLHVTDSPDSDISHIEILETRKMSLPAAALLIDFSKTYDVDSLEVEPVSGEQELELVAIHRGQKRQTARLALLAGTTVGFDASASGLFPRG